MKKTISLLKIGEIDPGILIILKKNLKWFFKKYKVKVEIHSEQLPLLESEKEPEHNNYNATQIKKRFSNIKNENYFCILGVTDTDLFTRFTRNIFGVADLRTNESVGRALISIYRLKEEPYRKENIAQFELRILKEAIHELGHTFGLEHCENQCVMLKSHKIEDVNRKPYDFCDICQKKVVNYLKRPK
jgi:archaemetzincin